MSYAIKTRSDIKTDKGNYFEVMFTEKIFSTENEAKDFIEKMKLEDVSLADSEEERERISTHYDFCIIVPVEEKNNGHELGYEIKLNNAITEWIQK